MSAQILLFPTGHPAKLDNHHDDDCCNDPDIIAAEQEASRVGSASPETVVTECMREVLIVCQKYALVPDMETFRQNLSYMRDVAFADEAVRAMVYRYSGMNHRWHSMIDRTVKMKDEV